MNTAKIETWVWLLIYAGMALAALGLWSLGRSPVAGHVLAWTGAALVAAGIALLVVRSRLRGPDDAPPAATPPTHREGPP